MENKIIRLESLFLMDQGALMDQDGNISDGNIFQTTRIIEVGHPYGKPHNNPIEHHSDRDVVSIECIRSLCGDAGYCYLVKLKGGNELYLPIHAFIAETKEVTDDDE